MLIVQALEEARREKAALQAQAAASAAATGRKDFAASLGMMQASEVPHTATEHLCQASPSMSSVSWPPASFDLQLLRREAIVYASLCAVLVEACRSCRHNFGGTRNTCECRMRGHPVQQSFAKCLHRLDARSLLSLPVFYLQEAWRRC